MAKLEYTVIIDTPFPCRKCPLHCNTCIRSDKITIEVESPEKTGQPAQMRFRQLVSPPPVIRQPPPVYRHRSRSVERSEGKTGSNTTRPHSFHGEIEECSRFYITALPVCPGCIV